MKTCTKHQAARKSLAVSQRDVMGALTRRAAKPQANTGATQRLPGALMIRTTTSAFRA